ncbi:Low-temperature-induced 65 kDa protein [Bienertia sinuspersici]
MQYLLSFNIWILMQIFMAMAGQSEGVTKQHEPKLRERTQLEGAPVTSRPGDYQTFDPTTARYPHGQDETTLGWSRTDTGRPKEYEDQPYVPKNTPVVMHSGRGQNTGGRMGLDRGPQAQKHVGEVRHHTGGPMGLDKGPQALKNVGEVRHLDPTGTGYNSMTAQSFTPGQHKTNYGERAPIEGATHVPPTSEPHGNYQTVQPTTTASHVPGQEDNWGWSKNDTGMLKGSAEMSDTSKNTPIIAHLGGNHGTGAEERNIGRRGVVLGNREHLEKDPNAVRDPGEKPHAENYQAKVADPTGEGGEAIGVTPILHQLDKMNIHEEPQQKSNIRSRQEESMFKPKHSPEDQKISTGSHNQFSPEPITTETSKFLQTPESKFQSSGHEGPHEEPHDRSEQEQGSYTDKISAAAAMVADKAKQATSSVTSKLGYGGSSDQHPATTASSGLHGEQSETRGYGRSDQQPSVTTSSEGLHGKQQSEAGGYGEKISTTTAADKAAQAKDVVATKLGYGGNHEGGTIVDTVKGSIAPVYNKVAEVGSNMAKKVQGSGTGREVGPTSTTGPTDGPDKGVSMKQYLVEKLRPGEDDKALSEVITEALPLHKRKEDVSKSRGEGEEGKKVPVKGRVTESEEVKRRLGSSEDTSYDNAGSGLASPGKGVIDRLKDAANFWYQKRMEGEKEGSSDMSNEEQKRVTKASMAI